MYSPALARIIFLAPPFSMLKKNEVALNQITIKIQT